MKSWLVDLLLILGAIAGLLPGCLLGGGGLPPILNPTVEVSRATYVYEKDDGGVPPSVEFALNEINKGGKIVASVIEDDIQDVSGQTPQQFKVAVDTAKKEGLPALVVEAGETVVRTVKAPTTETEVLEAIE